MKSAVLLIKMKRVQVHTYISLTIYESTVALETKVWKMKISFEKEKTAAVFKCNNFINYTLFDGTKQNHTVRNTTRHSTAAQAYNLGQN